MQTNDQSYFDTVVVGGGQAGLAAGYHLQRTGRTFLIVDANQRPGDVWRSRWDSLRLFSPAQHDALPGLPFPAPPGTFPTKDQMACYLDGYAQHFELPILSETRVTQVTSRDGEMGIRIGARRLTSSNVIVATGAYSRPRVPVFADELDPAVTQLHSSNYRRPSSVDGDPVLVVGFGTSGTEIAADFARAGRRVLLSGRPTVQALSRVLPKLFSAANPVLRILDTAYWSFIHRVVTIDTPMGRKARAQAAQRGQPLIRLNCESLRKLGVEHVPRVAGVSGGRPQLEDGRVVDAAAVIWCTGFVPHYPFLDVPACPFDAKGKPIAPHGVVRQAPGLYFLGMPFQTGLTSSLVGGVGRDAAHVVGHILANRPKMAKVAA
jgi:putative flavoprotein involved in K+ transport